MKRAIEAIISWSTLIIFVSAIFLLIFGQGLLVSKKKAIKALQTNGFTDVKILKRQWTLVKLRGGREGEDVRFVASATNPIGQKVKVYVFAEWPWKGIRVAP
jgi:hypothetical protein